MNARAWERGKRGGSAENQERIRAQSAEGARDRKRSAGAQKERKRWRRRADERESAAQRRCAHIVPPLTAAGRLDASTHRIVYVYLSNLPAALRTKTRVPCRCGPRLFGSDTQTYMILPHSVAPGAMSLAVRTTASPPSTDIYSRLRQSGGPPPPQLKSRGDLNRLLPLCNPLAKAFRGHTTRLGLSGIRGDMAIRDLFLFARCHETWLDGHTGLPLAFVKGSGHEHEDDNEVVMEGGEISASWGPLPDPGRTVENTLAVLRKGCQKGENSWDVWLKVWERKRGDCLVADTATQLQEPWKGRRALVVGTCLDRPRRPSRLPAVTYVKPGSQELQTIANALLGARRIVAITGAGISTAAGIPARAGLGTGIGRDFDCVPLHGSLATLKCHLCHELYEWENYRRYIEDYAIRDHRIQGGDDEDVFQLLLPYLRCNGRSEAREEAGMRRVPVGQLRPDMVILDETYPQSEEIAEIINGDVLLSPDFVLALGTSLTIEGPTNLLRQFALRARQ
ncbi:DHS-like NAD/FAD-binding domain-containing protein [Bombardia bombarda]|uniref:DHS-like NAD/FAD-binding domain-containing protein n=1 Tax=Bombardia bombarda TaxID=252184 RepID=A0AA39TZY6_9PEZI|nr:DHS-like NAD/FAD-binding domain-containing protein [Bombardia bombarda]